MFSFARLLLIGWRRTDFRACAPSRATPTLCNGPEGNVQKGRNWPQGRYQSSRGDPSGSFYFVGRTVVLPHGTPSSPLPRWAANLKWRGLAEGREKPASNPP